MHGQCMPANRPVHDGSQRDHLEGTARALVRDDGIDEQEVGEEIHLERRLEAILRALLSGKQNARIQDDNVEHSARGVWEHEHR